MAQQKLLKCIVITPASKIIECDTPSAILPSHDGQVGILPGHMPMFCRLGLGMMGIRGIATEKEVFVQDIYLIIDGGFALISKNLITVIADEAITAQDLKMERHGKILKEVLAKPAGAETPEQRLHDAKKQRLTAYLERIVSGQQQHTR